MEFKRISNHKIQITHTANGGCIAQVGCGTFAFTKPEEMLEALTEFYKDPQKMEKEYNSLGADVERTEPMDYGDEGQEERPTTRRMTLRVPGSANRVGVDDAFDESDNNF